MQYTGRRHKRHTAQVSHWASSVRGPSLNMATPAMRSRPGAAVRPCEGHSSSWPGSPRITGPGTRPALAGLGPRPHSADLLTVSSSWWETTVQVFGGKGSLFFPCGHTCPNKAGGGGAWELVGATLTPPPQDCREEVGRTTASPVLPVLNYSLRHPFLLSKRAGPEGAGEGSATM